MNRIRFSDFAARNPDALALVDSQERPWTRGELATRANKLARALRAAGLQQGDSFAVLAPNCFEYMVAYLAAMQAALYFVPLNWHLAAGELEYILRDSDARGLVAHERFGQMIKGIVSRLGPRPPVLICLGRIEGFVALDEFMAAESAEPYEEPLMGRMLAYTSATTGRPKGVMLSLEDAASTLDMQIQRRMAVGTMPEAHVQLCVSMLYHGAPLESVVAALHMGHVAVLTDTASPEAILRLIEKYRVTFLYIVPTLFARMLNLDESVRSRYSLATLQRVVHSGAPCPADVKRRMIDWVGPILWEAYGATEGAGTVVGSKDWLRFPGTVGRPIEGTKLKILSEAGEELPPGEIGIIYLTRFTGDRFHYRHDPEKTQACHRGDFFTVGDVGYVNEEGFLFISDRKIDMIIRSGMKVYSAEIENVLARHPRIVDCAVFGVPDEMTGEAIVAMVQLVPDAAESRELHADILRFLGEHLSPAKLPRTILYTPELPRDPTGKLKKRKLREQYGETLAVRGRA